MNKKFDSNAAFSLEDKVIIVTGGGTGIGKVYRQRLAAGGAKVVLADIANQEADEVAREIQLPGFGAPMQELRTMEIIGHIEIDKLSLQHMAVEDLVCLRDMCANVLDERIKSFGRVTFNS